MDDRYSVCIIDDETHVRKAITILGDWDSFNMRIIGEASDGEEGYKMIGRLSPHLVITDIKMPYFSGLELVEKMRKNSMDSKVLIVSGYDDFGYAREGIRLRVEGYLLKPIKPDELNYFLAEINSSLKLTKKPRTSLSSSAIKQGKFDIHSIEEYINQNYTTNITLEKTAEIFFISKEYLSKRFKEETGLNFSKYILKLKMEKAQDLLKSNYSPKKTGELVGYFDHVHFHKVFKSYFGTTPKKAAK